MQIRPSFFGHATAVQNLSGVALAGFWQTILEPVGHWNVVEIECFRLAVAR